MALQGLAKAEKDVEQRTGSRAMRTDDGRAAAEITHQAAQVIALNQRNPQVAARMARALENWRHFTPALQASIEPCLKQVLGSAGLSPDVAEIIEKALAER